MGDGLVHVHRPSPVWRDGSPARREGGSILMSALEFIDGLMGREDVIQTNVRESDKETRK